MVKCMEENPQAKKKIKISNYTKPKPKMKHKKGCHEEKISTGL